MGYRELDVYEKSYRAALAIYRMSTKFPQEEIYGMTSQMKRAATSIPLNIAEGYGKRESRKEFKRFLMMSIGSSDEISVLLDFAKDLGYIDDEKYTKSKAEYKEIVKMLGGLVKAVQSEV